MLSAQGLLLPIGLVLARALARAHITLAHRRNTLDQDMVIVARRAPIQEAGHQVDGDA